MSLQDRLRAGAASFSHLAGIGRTPVAARADDDDDRRPDDDKDSRRAEDDDDEDKKTDGKKGRRAEDDDDKDRDGDEDKKTDSKKGRRADDGDDDDGDEDSDKEEMRGRSTVASARARERGRCAAIFLSRHAAGNPAMAAQLAFGTKLSRKEAIAVLASAPRGAAGSLGRSGRNPDLGPGGERAATSDQAIQAGWDRSFTKAIDPLGARRRSA